MGDKKMNIVELAEKFEKGEISMNDEAYKKASDALPVGLHDGEDVLRHRPTLGWTVNEAWILWHRSIYSTTVQPRVGRWSIQLSRPWRRKEISKQYCFVAQKSTLTGPYAMKCFTAESILYCKANIHCPPKSTGSLEHFTRVIQLLQNASCEKTNGERWQHIAKHFVTLCGRRTQTD